MNRKLLGLVLLGACVLWTLGCGGMKQRTKHDHDDESHGHGTGPNGGCVFDLGKYHAEFKPDHAKKEATVWMLGLDEKTPARIKADKLRLVVANTNPKIEIDLLPTDQTPDGTASTFTGKHDGFAAEMEYEGTVSFTVGGKQSSGEFKEEPPKKK